MAMRGEPESSPANSGVSSVSLASQGAKARLPSSACHRANDTMAGESSGRGASSSRTSTHWSAAGWPLRIRGRVKEFWSSIYPLLERLEADTLIGFDELLALDSLANIDLQNFVDDFGHAFTGEGGTENLAEGGVITLGSTQRDLVPLFPFLVDAKNPDIAHM